MTVLRNHWKLIVGTAVTLAATLGPVAIAGANLKSI
jgi:hypothetical protein